VKVARSPRWRPDAPVLDLFSMARKPARGLMLSVVVVACWLGAASLAQGLLGADVGRGARELEERIEMRLRGQRAPVEPQPPDRTLQDESFEPWELVRV
jgi:hypothetical protein